MERRRIHYSDAGEGRSRWWQVRLFVLLDDHISLVLYRRPWSRICLAVGELPPECEPLVDSIVSHFEAALVSAIASRGSPTVTIAEE